MLFRAYDHEKELVRSMESDELTARITSCNAAGVDEPELLKVFAVMARTELARRFYFMAAKAVRIIKAVTYAPRPGTVWSMGLLRRECRRKSMRLLLQQAGKL